MDIETAKDYIQSSDDRRPSELGEAVVLLYQEYGSYKIISAEIGLSSNRLSQYHRIFKLPEGIRWQVDERKINIAQAMQISRLKDQEDQWLLAFTVVTKKLSLKDTQEAVNAVIKHNRPLRDVLHDLIGIRFDQVERPLLLLFSFEERFKMSRVAWTKKLDWSDFCLEAIRTATQVDVQQIVNELKRLVSLLEFKEDK
ncbi:MAG: hypothetical protein P9M15_03820 [Candidatus Electryoneaceae bacterium]|nr:hypothetical protein [Candidatus Electryoneaceae bacterium]